MAGVDVGLIVCGAPLTGRAPDLARCLQSAGWRPTVIGTPAAEAWLDTDAVADLTGSAPLMDFRSPSEPKQGGPPAAVVVCPATFNTVNKVAAGVADTYALAVMCEALATGIPLVVVPMVSTRLWGHPAWQNSLSVLRDAGAALVNVQTGGLDLAPAPSGFGDGVTARFDPRWIVAHVDRVTRH